MGMTPVAVIDSKLPLFRALLGAFLILPSRWGWERGINIDGASEPKDQDSMEFTISPAMTANL
jgi:hypothetical protein